MFFFSGVDIVGILEHLHVSETIISKLRDSSLGHWAVAYLCYKIASPGRYAVTLAGTTYTINILSSRGIIKPMPTRGELVQMYKDKKDDIQQKIEDKKQDFQQTKENLQQKVTDTKDEFYQKLEDKKQDIQMKIEEKKQDIQQKVTDKKHELEEKLKGRN
jgi:gas vesicle protein